MMLSDPSKTNFGPVLINKVAKWFVVADFNFTLYFQHEQWIQIVYKDLRTTTHVEFDGCSWLLCGREPRATKQGVCSTEGVGGGVGCPKQSTTAGACPEAWKDKTTWIRTTFPEISAPPRHIQILNWSDGITVNNKGERVLTSKRCGFVGTEGIVLLGEESTAVAWSSVSKQAGGRATRCTKAEASAGGGGRRLAECTGPEQTTWWGGQGRRFV